MKRTQIQLREEQARRLKEAARLEGVSMAEMVRRCVDRALPELTRDRSERYAEALSVVGTFRSEQDDLATDHDRYLDEAFE